MRTYGGSFFEGIRLLDADREPILDFTWDTFPRGGWSDEEEIPEGYVIAGLDVVTADPNYIRYLAVNLAKDHEGGL